MILKQTFKNHVVISGFTWIVTGILFGVWAYVNFDSAFLLVVGLFHLIFTIPALYLHVAYFLKNRGEEIEIKNNELILRKNGKEKRFNNYELSKIILYKPGSLDRGGIPFSAIEYYRYARIITKSGEEIIITCLMILNIEKALQLISGVPFERKRRIAFLFWK